MRISEKFFTCKCIASFMLVLVLFAGCAEKQKDGSTEITDNINYISYCAKEETLENRIYFNYPQLKETESNANRINELIIGFVESVLYEVCNGDFKGNLKDFSENWEWNNNDYTIQAMDIDYRVVRNDADYFSITFEGLYNYRTSAHPINFFRSLIIDVKKCELITLSDLYHINSDFVNLFQEKLKEQFQIGLAEKAGVLPEEVFSFVDEALLEFDDNFLLEGLHQADKNSDYGFHSFLTDGALGISVPLNHAIGDHFEIMINYEELKEYLIAENY